MKKKPSRKEIFSLISLALILLAGLVAAGSLVLHKPTFDGKQVDVIELMEKQAEATGEEEEEAVPFWQKRETAANAEEADGVAAVMVKENLAKTVSPNAVFSIVFNFRGYDTMSESFVLYTAVCGTAVILRRILKKKSAEGEEANA